MKYHLPILAAFLFILQAAGLSQQTTVTLDYFFNNEYKMNPQGEMERFHYTWEDKSINGYTIWADLFKARNAKVGSLPTAPSAASLKGTDIYIICDPDTDKETTQPNYMTPAYASAIAEWVKKGGVLVLMANDSANAELPRFNLLTGKFGLQFTNKTRNAVIKDISVGKIMVPEQHDIFIKAKQLYLKGISTITVQGNAKPVLEDKGDIIMASARYGKGIVFAIGDPWIYNEYIVNDRLSPDFQNGIAAAEFTDWLLKQVPAKKS